MAFNINGFRTQLRLDGARPNLFEVRMPFPGPVLGGGPASQDLTFMCKTAQLPGSSVSQVVVPYFGREVKLSGNRTFPEWTVTVINDENFSIKNAFERWMGALNSHEGNLRNSTFFSATSYGVSASVIQFAKTGESIKNYEFVGMFPIEVSPIDVDWGANDTVEEFTVTFAYQYWLANGLRGGNTTDRAAAVR